MRRLVLSPGAVSDINGIWDYTAGRWGPDKADDYTDGLRDACHALAEGSKQGRRLDIRDGYLKYVLGAHVIYFRHDGQDLVVIRILHGRMDIGRHL